MKEFREEPTTKTIRRELESVAKCTDELKKAIDSHPSIKAYLAGIASMDERFDSDWGDGRRLVDEKISGFSDIGLWAKIALATGTGGRDIWFPGGPAPSHQKISS